MKKMISLFAFMFLLPAIARADSCSTLPDCESMGYFLGYNAACGTDDSRYIFCPYDTDYRKCVDYDCEGMGFTQTDKTEWCKTIVNCLYDSAYTLCDEPKDEQCEVVTCPPAVSIPANAHGISECTPVNADCSKGTKVYTDWTCNNGYHDENGTCVEDEFVCNEPDEDCSDLGSGAVIYTPGVNPPSTFALFYICTPKVNCEQTGPDVHYWRCPSGWVKKNDGTGCEVEPDCPKGCSDLTAYAWEADSVIEHGYVDLSAGSGCAYTVYGSEADECLQSGRCTMESGCVVHYRYKNIVCDAGYHPKKVSTGYVGCEAD